MINNFVQVYYKNLLEKNLPISLKIKLIQVFTLFCSEIIIAKYNFLTCV